MNVKLYKSSLYIITLFSIIVNSIDIKFTQFPEFVVKKDERELYGKNIFMGLIFLPDYDKIIQENSRDVRKSNNTTLLKNEVFEIKIKGVDVGEVIKSLKTKDGRKEFYRKHKLIILYVTFGIGTTIISFGSYYLFRFIFPNAESVPSWLSWIFKLTAPFNIESSTVFPVIMSWIFANLFSFFTNRVYVFESQAHSVGRFLLEMLKFFASRIATLIVDMVIMFLLVDLTGIHGGLYEFCAKIFSNIVVLVLNFILSKLFVFRKKKQKSETGNDDN